MHVESSESARGKFATSPKVSVCVTTYNQSKYIGQCLQSIVEQETSFIYEVIVSDDCSTDGARQILIEYQKKYPDLIRCIFQEKNLGAAMNYKHAHLAAEGEFVAHLDGDDVMCPGKLQKQVSVLEANPSCVMVTHDMHLLDGEGRRFNRTFKRIASGLKSRWDLYGCMPFFAHSSKLCRRDLEAPTLALIDQSTVDFELHVLLAEMGFIYHMDEPLGGYRVGIGVTRGANGRLNWELIEASHRVFRRAIKKYPNNRRFLRNSYAKAMLKYLYQAAVYKDSAAYRSLLFSSLSVYRAEWMGYLLRMIPEKLIFKIAEVRNRKRFSI